MDRYTVLQSGRFTAVSGKVVVKLGDIEYAAAENEFVPLGSSIRAYGNSVFQIQFENGEIRSNSTAPNNQSSLLKVNPETDIERLQAIIAAGGDPTAVLPETAAGGDNANNGGFDVTVLERSAEETLASTSFDSVGIGVSSSPAPDDAADFVNAAPQIAEPAPAIVDEAGVDSDNVPIAGIADVSGQLEAGDDDNALSELTWRLESDQNAYGTFVLDEASGAWSFSLNNEADIVQALQESETVELEYLVTVNDGQGGIAETTVSITVTGTNDAPVITGQSFTGTVDESGVDAGNNPVAGSPAATGQLTATDVDNSQDQLTWTLQSGQNDYGVFDIDPDTGAWRFTLNNDNPAVQALQNGQSLPPIVYTVRVSDGVGGYAETTVSITVTGTNDAPVITGQSFTGTVDESGVDAGNNPVAGSPAATGQLTATDVDNSQDQLTWTLQSGQNDYGVFDIDPDTGAWRFTLNNDNPAVQALQNGQSLPPIVYTVRVSDGVGGYAETTVSITVTGTNDAPVITGQSFTGTVDESGVDAGNNPVAGSPAATGQLTATDVDNSQDQLTWTLQSGQNDYGVFDIDPDTGAWRFTLNNDNPAVQALQNGQSLPPIVYTVRVSDGVGGYAETTVSITVTGTNDAPVITGQSFTGTVDESGVDAGNNPVAGSPAATGQLTATDVDNSQDQLTWTLQSGQNDYGVFDIDPDTGAWRFTLNNDNPAVQALQNGQSLPPIVYTVRVSDGVGGYAETTVSITVTGTNDAPVITGQSFTGTVDESGVDAGNNPVAGSPAATGQLTATDVDNSQDQLTWTLQSGQNDYGMFDIDPDTGAWRFTLNNDNPAVQALQNGQSLPPIVYTVRVSDGVGGYAETTVSITVTGTNDAPVITGQSFTGTVDESGVDAGNNPVAGSPAATGQLTATDVDNSQDQLTWTLQSGQNDYGVFDIDPDTGAWRFTLNNDNPAVQALQNGQSLPPIVYTVRVSDGVGGYAETTVSITVTGTNDAPVITGQSFTGTVDESGVDAGNNPVAGSPAATGQLTATDVDNSQDQLTWTLQSGQNDYGVFDIDPDTGAWRFTLNNDNPAVQALQNGQSLPPIVYTVRVSDGVGGYAETTVSITVTGTNDAPVITGQSFTGTVDESGVDAGNNPVAGSPAATGQLTATDVDNSQDQLTWTLQSGQNDYGVFDIDPDTGAWRFTLNNDNPAVQALQNDQSLPPIVYTVRVSDGLGGYAETTVSITVTGTNDAPKITNEVFNENVFEAGVDKNNVDIYGTPIAKGVLKATDVDNSPAELTWSLISSTEHSELGTFSLNADSGEWTFELNNDSLVVQQMKTGDSKTLFFTVRVTDAQNGYAEQVITVVINGQNDRPDAEDDRVMLGETPLTSFLTDNKGNLFTVNLIDGTSGPAVTTTHNGQVIKLTDVAVSPTGLLYGISFNSFYIVNPLTGDLTALNDPVADTLNALTFSHDGRMFAAGGDHIFELHLDPASGQLSVLNTYSNLNASSNGDMVYSQGNLYWTTDADQLVKFDLETATLSTVIEDLGLHARNYGLVLGRENELFIFNGNDVYKVDIASGELQPETVLAHKDIISNRAWGASNIPDTVQGNVLTNDSDIEGDALTVIQVQFGDVTVDSGQVIYGKYGYLMLNSDGSFTYVLDTSLASTAQLREGEETQEQFTYTASDGNGGLDNAVLNVKITGHNDLPYIVSATDAVISEEGLNDIANNFIGIEDEEGNPADQTRFANASGEIIVADVDSDSLTVSFGQSPTFITSDGTPVTLTSGGQAVQWIWSEASAALIGYIGTIGSDNYQTVMALTLTPPSDSDENKWTYDVNIQAPVDHPDTHSEDIIIANFEINVADEYGYGEPKTISITIEDDSPKINESGVHDVSYKETLSQDFDLTGEYKTVEKLELDGFIITAKGFTADNNSTLIYRDIVVTNAGLGIVSPESYQNLSGEIIFRHINEGGQISDQSEELTITLEEGRLATEVTLSFANMYSDNSQGDVAPEKGKVDFYRNGGLIASIEFTSNAADGNYTQLFNSALDAGLAQGFDQIIISAVDNDQSSSRTGEDNSDFSLAGIQFNYLVQTTKGTVDFGFGADGSGNIVLAGLETQTLLTSNGEAVNLAVTDSAVIATTADGDLVFELGLNTTTGQWQFQQYQNLQSFDNDILNFQVLVTDRDGDNTQGGIYIRPTLSHPPVAEDDEIEVEEDTTFNYVISLLGNDSDADGDNLSVLAGTFITDKGGTIIINTDGSYIYTPGQNFHGEDSVVYTITDGEYEDTATLRITVTPVVDPVVMTTGAAIVSEEGLTHAGHIGLGDERGDPQDETDEISDSGYIRITNNVDNNQLNASFSAPTQSYTSSGLAVQWHWDSDAQSYIGYTGVLNGYDYLEIISVNFTESSDDHGSTWSYHVTLHQPFDHPNTEAEYTLNLNFGVTLTDANGRDIPAVNENGEPLDTLAVNVVVEDDSPEVNESDVISVTDNQIPEVLVGQFDLTAATGSSMILDFDGFNITAKGFTSATYSTLIASQIVSTDRGIGVKSSGSAYRNFNNQVEFRFFGNDEQQGVSEQLIINLDEGTLAFGVKLSFTRMFGREVETGIVDFYRDGKWVASVPFSSDEDSGNYAADFKVEEGGFDQMVIKATDNGQNNPRDNSDFSISSIEFFGEPALPIAYAGGVLEYQWGADGAGNISLLGINNQTLLTTSGEPVNVVVNGNTLTGSTASSIVFQLIFTPETGEWDFYQYQTLQSVAGSSIDISVKVTDADGDNKTGKIRISPKVSDFMPELKPDNNEITESDIPANAAFVGDGRGNIAWVDIETGAVHQFYNVGGPMTDIAYSQDGQLYGVSFTSFYIIDPFNKSMRFVDNFGSGINDVNALVVSPDGDIYAARNTSSQLLKINLNSSGTGMTTEVVIDDMGFKSAGDLVFHNDELYMTFIRGQQSGLVKIDIDTGHTEIVVSQFGDSLKNFGLVSANDGNLYGFNGDDIFLLRPQAENEADRVEHHSKIYGLGEIWGAANQPRAESLVIGNVLENDGHGNDEETLTVTAISFDNKSIEVYGSVTLEGAYGSLTIDARGEYHYVLDDDKPATEALTGADSEFEVFTYTVSHSQGVQAQSTLTIQVNGVDDYQFTGGESDIISIDADGSAADLDAMSNLIAGNGDAGYLDFADRYEETFNVNSNLLLQNVEILTHSIGILEAEAGIINSGGTVNSQIQTIVETQSAELNPLSSVSSFEKMHDSDAFRRGVFIA